MSEKNNLFTGLPISEIIGGPLSAADSAERNLKMMSDHIIEYYINHFEKDKEKDS